MAAPGDPSRIPKAMNDRGGFSTYTEAGMLWSGGRNASDLQMRNTKVLPENQQYSLGYIYTRRVDGKHLCRGRHCSSVTP